MHVKSISGTVTTTVVLGEGNYGDRLTITPTGEINAYTIGAPSIYAPPGLSHVEIRNEGLVKGSLGGNGSKLPGGIAIDLASAAKVSNTGSIVGGYGVYSHSTHIGYAGGGGLELQKGGQVSNFGTIIGGAAGYEGPGGGYHGPGGGFGVDLSAASTLTNQGFLAGGSGGTSYIGPGYGGNAVDAAGGSITNVGTIVGGAGGNTIYREVNGANGGAGVDLTGAGTLVNSGSISGGAGGYADGEYGVGGKGGDGVDFSARGMLINIGTIAGGIGGNGFYSGLGGTGVNISSGSIINHGLITGGTGVIVSGDASLNNTGKILGVYGTDGVRGDGIRLYGDATVRDSGSIVAESSAEYAGGIGAILKGGTLIVSGNVVGGGGSTSRGYSAGTAGVDISSGTIRIASTGSIVGGAGGNGNSSDNYGGAGIYVSRTGSALIADAGSILGGAGGRGSNGGVGVYLGGGTISVTGSVAGGAGAGKRAQGYAVQFGFQAGTLEISTTAKISGDIVANPQADDTLILESKGAGTLAGFGSTITGLSTIEEENKGNWTLIGSVTGAGLLSIGTDAKLTLNGSVSIATVAFDAGGGERLNLDAPTQFTSAVSGFGTGDTIDLVGIQASSLTYAGHTLKLFDSGGVAVDTLTFDGKYVQGDFALKAIHGGTEVIYAGGNDQARGLSDFVPEGIMPIQSGHGGFGDGLGGGYLAAGCQGAPEDFVMVHFGHLGAAG
jgi:hypothetical protein